MKAAAAETERPLCGCIGSLCLHVWAACSHVWMSLKGNKACRICGAWTYTITNLNDHVNAASAEAALWLKNAVVEIQSPDQRASLLKGARPLEITTNSPSCWCRRTKPASGLCSRLFEWMKHCVYETLRLWNGLESQTGSGGVKCNTGIRSRSVCSECVCVKQSHFCTDHNLSLTLTCSRLRHKTIKS